MGAATICWIETVMTSPSTSAFDLNHVDMIHGNLSKNVRARVSSFTRHEYYVPWYFSHVTTNWLSTSSLKYQHSTDWLPMQESNRLSHQPRVRTSKTISGFDAGIGGMI